jgi:predicted metal-dependent hydrolase
VSFPLTIKRNARARRIILRMSNAGAVVTAPGRVSEREVMRFVSRHEDWLRAQQQRLPQPVPFAPGAIIPFQGQPHTIRLSGSLRGVVERYDDFSLSPLPVGEGYPGLGERERNLALVGEGLKDRIVSPSPSIARLETRQAMLALSLRERGQEETSKILGAIILPCLAEHAPRRLKDYLKSEARLALARAVAEKAVALNLRPPAFSLRDTTSRWGSCSPGGTLSFSWRLILAPPEVLDYVAAHEVAHIREMNHGPHFWKLCESLVADMEPPRAWLRRNGPDLHRYGAP